MVVSVNQKWAFCKIRVGPIFISGFGVEKILFAILGFDCHVAAEKDAWRLFDRRQSLAPL